MSKDHFEVGDSHQLEGWVDQIKSGQTEVVEVHECGEVVAELRKPSAPPSLPPGWIVAGHYFHDHDLPGPFAGIKYETKDIVR